MELFLISIEHQITTTSVSCTSSLYCFSFQQSIKSQRFARAVDKLCYCFSFQQSIKSQLRGANTVTPSHCFSFQQSIKSQQTGAQGAQMSTVSHFNRASNHNYVCVINTLAQLFLISIEHQITTLIELLRLRMNCFSFQQSIKSQHVAPDRSGRINCFSFQQSIKSQRRLNAFAQSATVSHFNRASNHN